MKKNLIKLKLLAIVCYMYKPIVRYCFFFACLLFCLFICSLCKLLLYLVNKDVYKPALRVLHSNEQIK